MAPEIKNKGGLMRDYPEKVKNYFKNPRNAGEVLNPDGVGEVGSLAFGNFVIITFKLDKMDELKMLSLRRLGSPWLLHPLQL
jgi:NifU-like protein